MLSLMEKAIAIGAVAAWADQLTFLQNFFFTNLVRRNFIIISALFRLNIYSIIFYIQIISVLWYSCGVLKSSIWSIIFKLYNTSYILRIFLYTNSNYNHQSLTAAAVGWFFQMCHAWSRARVPRAARGSHLTHLFVDSFL
jgi:hypothetical protein